MVSSSFEAATVIGVMKLGLVYVPIPVFGEPCILMSEFGYPAESMSYLVVHQLLFTIVLLQRFHELDDI
jgi:hypothetical protein